MKGIGGDIPFTKGDLDKIFAAIIGVLQEIHPGLSVARLLSARRDFALIAEIRMIGMYLLCEHCGINRSRSGGCFFRDRATVRHACKTVAQWRINFPLFDEQMIMLQKAVTEKLNAPVNL